MDIDKLIPRKLLNASLPGFGSLMDIDKLILPDAPLYWLPRFGSLMDIDKLILVMDSMEYSDVLVL